MNQKIHFRAMKKKDWQKFQLIDSEIFPKDIILKEQFTKWIDREGFFAGVLDRDEMVGYLILDKIGENLAHLGRIGVAPSVQSRGIGTKMMEFALKWFQIEGKSPKVILYTQEDNIKAQKLYKKFNFERVATTWHYFVPFKDLKPNGNYQVYSINENEISTISERYSTSLPVELVLRFIERKQRVFILKDLKDKIVGACRFDPEFPGCFPFEIECVTAVDDFLNGLRPFSLPKFDYIRLTFTDNKKLAQVLEDRNFRLHHKLFKMELDLPKIKKSVKASS